MKNMGFQRLVLVNPQCDPLGTEARQMAVHAVDVLESAQQVGSLLEALRGCQRAIATTARARTLETPLEHPRIALPWLLDKTELETQSEVFDSQDNAEAATSTLQSALLFGPEDRGLSNAELNYAQRFVYIPTTPVYPSLNLAQAVAICCYEMYQLVEVGKERGAIAGSVPQSVHQEGASADGDDKIVLPAPHRSPNLASLEILERYYQQLETVLLKIGYLYPHTATSRMEKFRRLFNRAYLTTAEVAMLRGILSQVEWALSRSCEQSTYKEDSLSPSEGTDQRKEEEG